VPVAPKFDSLKFNVMTPRDQNIPTEAELEILSILWDNNPASVREINNKLNEIKEVGYTTTLKIMQIMHKKGLVERNTDQRTHLYSPVIQKNNTQKKLVGNLLDKAFKGSAANLVLQVLGNHKASKEELDEIRQLIDKIDKEDR
jgi:BlaI family penicillinase repressor